MSTVEIHATASHKYYMRKTKDEIIWRIHSMARDLDMLGIPAPNEARQLPICLRQLNTKDELATLAMRCHDCFPKDKTPFEYVKTAAAGGRVLLFFPAQQISVAMYDYAKVAIDRGYKIIVLHHIRIIKFDNEGQGTLCFFDERQLESLYFEDRLKGIRLADSNRATHPKVAPYLR